MANVFFDGPPALAGSADTKLQQLYSHLGILSSKLNAHLEDIDRAASEMFDLLMKQYAAREGVTEQLKAEFAPILQRKGNTIFVSAEIASDGAAYSPETEVYKSVLTAINRHLVQSCDAAFELVCGIPVKIKGELPC